MPLRLSLAERLGGARALMGGLMGRVGWAVILVGLVFGALGFHFQTPGTRFEELAARDSTLDLRMTRAEAHLSNDEMYLRALAIDLCLSRPRSVTQQEGLPCARLLAGRTAGSPALP